MRCHFAGSLGYFFSNLRVLRSGLPALSRRAINTHKDYGACGVPISNLATEKVFTRVMLLTYIYKILREITDIFNLAGFKISRKISESYEISCP